MRKMGYDFVFLGCFVVGEGILLVRLRFKRREPQRRAQRAAKEVKKKAFELTQLRFKHRESQR